MDIDQISDASRAAGKSHDNKRRNEKKGKSKAKAAMIFPVFKKGRKIGPRLTARQKRISLRP